MEPLLVMDTDGEVTCLRFMDNRLYAGLADGRLAIYNRDKGQGSHLLTEMTLCLLLLEFPDLSDFRL